MDRLLRMSEVADRLQIGESTAYQLAREGKLPVVRFGRAVRVEETSLQRWLQESVEFRSTVSR